MLLSIIDMIALSFGRWKKSILSTIVLYDARNSRLLTFLCIAFVFRRGLSWSPCRAACDPNAFREFRMTLLLKRAYRDVPVVQMKRRDPLFRRTSTQWTREKKDEPTATA